MRYASLLVVFALGCSALIDPDGSRLGGGDGGPDDGGRNDGGLDASTDAATDVPTLDASGCERVCDDGVVCTRDECVLGACVYTPDDTACVVGQRCDRTAGCILEVCDSDEDCDDRDPCNGVESCDMGTGRCVATVPVECSDGLDCTTDSCEAGVGCRFEPNDAACEDGVECTVGRCDAAIGCVQEADDGFCDDDVCRMGGFCDPDRGCVGSVRRNCSDGDRCTQDDCDPLRGGCFSVPRDADEDGFPASRVGGASCEDGSDCDDTNPDVNPDATELCNGIDDDCDELVDEGCDVVPDDCGSAIEIPLMANVGQVTGSFADASHDYESECTSGRIGPDLVYYFDVAGGILGGTFDVIVDTFGSSADTILALSPDCGDWTWGGLGCNDDFDSPALDSRVWIHRLSVSPAGGPTRVYVLLDAFRTTETADWVINVRVQNVAGDGCFGGRLDITGGGSVIGLDGSVAGFGFHRGSCESDGAAGAEQIFDFTPSAGTRFTATAESFSPSLYVRRACNDSDSEVACDQATAIGGGLNEAEVNVDEGSVVFVDGLRGGDSYTLEYEPG